MMLERYPIQLRLRDRAVLLVGAGPVAARKLERLVACGARVRVVATAVCDVMHRLVAEHSIALEVRAFQDDDVRETLLVIAATDDRTVNERVARCARAAGALVLRVDAPEDSDFTLPAHARSEHVDATISTGGQAPAASRRLARELSAWLLTGPDRFAAEVARARLLLANRRDSAQRLRNLAEGALFAACRVPDEAQIAELMRTTLATSPLETP